MADWRGHNRAIPTVPNVMGRSWLPEPSTVLLALRVAAVPKPSDVLLSFVLFPLIKEGICMVARGASQPWKRKSHDC
jgi:hypothetical protein